MNFAVQVEGLQEVYNEQKCRPLEPFLIQSLLIHMLQIQSLQALNSSN